jgi:putative endonuclease
MTNKYNNVLYTGVSGNLGRRCYEHWEKSSKGFTKSTISKKLVYYEIFDNPSFAIAREKQIKAGSRKKKKELINSVNPEWKDLYNELCLW